MPLPPGRVTSLFAPIFLVACAGKGADATAIRNGYCGDKTPGLIAAAGEPADPAAPVSETAVDGSSCNAVERSYAIGKYVHVPPCAPVSYDTNPPAGGDHYTLFPQFRAYDYAIPRGFWVHSLEHGGIVITYSCVDCAEDVAAARALLDQTGPDATCCSASGCPATATNQLLLTPDPGIPTRWAASSWGATLTADCFEPDVFQHFIDAHRDSDIAPENAKAAGPGICANTYAVDVQPSPQPWPL